MMVKRLRVDVPDDLWEKFKHRCHFYEVPAKETITLLMYKFMQGHFDKELNIPTMEDEFKPKG